MWYELQNAVESLPREAGIYLFSATPSIGGTLYVGQAGNLAEEVRETLGRDDSPVKRLPARYFTYEKTDELEEAARGLIEVLRPVGNR
jgi:excinuclease UvrABC nuclease subunit